MAIPTYAHPRNDFWRFRKHGGSPQVDGGLTEFPDDDGGVVRLCDDDSRIYMDCFSYLGVGAFVNSVRAKDRELCQKYDEAKKNDKSTDNVSFPQQSAAHTCGWKMRVARKFTILNSNEYLSFMGKKALVKDTYVL